jgi:hypothetical protein
MEYIEKIATIYLEHYNEADRIDLEGGPEAERCALNFVSFAILEAVYKAGNQNAFHQAIKDIKKERPEFIVG